MQVKFEKREREIMRALLFVARSYAVRNKDKSNKKLANRMINQLSDNSEVSNLKSKDLKQMKKILEHSVEDASVENSDGVRRVSHEDEKTIRGIIEML